MFVTCVSLCISWKVYKYYTSVVQWRQQVLNIVTILRVLCKTNIYFCSISMWHDTQLFPGYKTGQPTQLINYSSSQTTCQASVISNTLRDEWCYKYTWSWYQWNSTIIASHVIYVGDQVQILWNICVKQHITIIMYKEASALCVWILLKLVTFGVHLVAFLVATLLNELCLLFL